jgi:LysR family nitrogen assimilation transcriptional regulator
LDIRQLRYFVAIATFENFSKAAQQLHVAQSALSRQIKVLEEELGVTLFERHLRGATLTPEGLELRKRAQHLLRIFDQVKEDVAGVTGDPSGSVVVGLNPQVSNSAGAQLVQQFLREYPRGEFKFVEALSPRLQEMVSAGDVDIAVLSGRSPTEIPQVAIEPLFEDQACLIGKADDPLLQRPEIPIQSLRSLPLILHGLRAGIRNELEILANKKRVPLNVVVEVESTSIAKQLIREGMGYGVAYALLHLGAGVGDRRLAAVPISGLWMQRSLAWAIDRPLSPLAGQVLRSLRATMIALVESGGWRTARKLNSLPAAKS